MGIYHFSGLFVLLCLGLGSALLGLLGELVFYRLALPRIRRGNRLQYWLHTSQRIHRALNLEPPDGSGRRSQNGVPRGPEMHQQQDMIAAPANPGGWTRVRRAAVKQRRVRFLLEPAMAAASPAADMVAGGARGSSLALLQRLAIRHAAHGRPAP